MMNRRATIPDQDINDSFRWHQASHMLFCLSLKDADAFLSNHHSSFPDARRLLCISVGLLPQKTYLQAFIPRLKNKKIILLMPDDLSVELPI